MASDVIYCTSKVPALMDTIVHCAAPGASVVIATRDGRLGVREFEQAALLQPELEHVETIRLADSAPSAAVERPLCFRAHGSESRWHAAHSIMIFRRKRVNAKRVRNELR